MELKLRIVRWHPVQVLVLWIGGFAVLGSVAWQYGALSNRSAAELRQAAHDHAERSRELGAARARVDSAERWYFELRQTGAVPEVVEDSRQQARSLRTDLNGRAELVSARRKADQRRIARRAQQAANMRYGLLTTVLAVIVALLVATWIWASGRSAAASP
ncbi:MAG: hypothetical protein WEA80_04500 [Gemmatimonadaceae bacterium]